MDKTEYKQKLGAELANACLLEFSDIEVLAMIDFVERFPDMKEPASEAVSRALLVRESYAQQKWVKDHPVPEMFYG
jgi:hypothetical protein